MGELEFDVGRSVPFHVARDPVSLPILRRWCDAIGVKESVHTDPVYAARSRFGQVVAPLTLLDVWTKPGLAYERDISDPQGGAFEILDRAGFTSAMAVTSELAQQRPLVLGDLVQSTLTLESVSPEKSTAVGPAHFVATRQDFFVADELVGHTRFTVMKFRPKPDASTPAEPRTSGSPTDRRVDDSSTARDDLGTLQTHALREGQRMWRVEIPITPTLIISGALMTSDYFEPHHDRDNAVQRGSRDIFMNIHTSLGLIERCIGEWLGPNAEWQSISTRLGTPNYPGDLMVVDAEVSSIDRTSGASTIGFRTANGLGMHAVGSVDVVLPA